MICCVQAMLVNSNFVGTTFHRLGAIDDSVLRLRLLEKPKHTPWAWGADAGNKGREIDMIAVSVWNFEKNAPEYLAIAAADLLGDQGSKHLAATLDRHVSAKGYHAEGCIQGMTDGASACAGEEGEAALYLRTLSQRSAADPTAPVHAARRETCCIHAKALEENHGLEAAFPEHSMCWFTRLIWECFSRKGGHADEFKKIWVEDCRLPPSQYDFSLGMLPEPTESKWQVMYDVCFRLHGLFDVAPGRQGLGSTMFEEFLAKCIDVLRGTEDRSSAKKVGCCLPSSSPSPSPSPSPLTSHTHTHHAHHMPTICPTLTLTLSNIGGEARVPRQDYDHRRPSAKARAPRRHPPHRRHLGAKLRGVPQGGAEPLRLWWVQVAPHTP